MEIASVGKVVSVRKGKAVVESMGKRMTLPVRGSLKLKPGDKVLVAFQSIVDKVR